MVKLAGVLEVRIVACDCSYVIVPNVVSAFEQRDAELVGCKARAIHNAGKTRIVHIPRKLLREEPWIGA